MANCTSLSTVLQYMVVSGSLFLIVYWMHYFIGLGEILQMARGEALHALYMVNCGNLTKELVNFIDIDKDFPIQNWK